MADDPQQQNPNPSSLQNIPNKPGGMDGVDISELAKRVESLSAELERITHESNPEQRQKQDLDQSPAITASRGTPPAPSKQVESSASQPDDQDNADDTTDPPQSNPTASEKIEIQSALEHETEVVPNTPPAQTAPASTPSAPSREGVNLSSLKQRVLESSTFGSRVTPATKEPFDPLDLTERTGTEADKKETVNTNTAPVSGQITPPADTSAKTNEEYQENTPIEVSPSTEPSTKKTDKTDTIDETDTPLASNPETVKSTSNQPRQTSDVPESPAPQPIPTKPEPRPTGPAHEFFDTIEWHARNDADQESKKTQTPPAPQEQPIAPAEVAEPNTIPRKAEQKIAQNGSEQPQTLPDSSTVQEAPAPAQNENTAITLQEPQQSTENSKPSTTTQQETNVLAQPATPEHDATIPRAPIPREDLASLTGSEHAGVEFVTEVPYEQRPLEEENREARAAIEAQRQTIDGILPGQFTSHQPIAPTSSRPILSSAKPSQAPAIPPAQPTAYSQSPLTGQSVPSQQDEEPVPSTLKPIRTFQDDIAQRVQTRDTSIVSIASAEQERLGKEAQEKERNAKQKKKRGDQPPAGIGTYIKIGLSGLLIGVSLAGLAFFGYLFFQPSDTVVVDTLPEYIFSDEQTRVDVTGQARREFMNTLLAEKEKVSLRLGAISYLYLTLTSRLPEGGERINLLSSTEFFERLEADVSGSLTRSIEPMMMFGVHVFDGNPPFLIFKVNFFENAFAGMLQWEDKMQVDLSPLFGPAILIPQRPSSDTPPESIQPSSPNLGQFTDEIVRNKEVRVLRDSNDKIVLLYGFVDRDTLVITTNEFTFAEIVTRLSSRRF